jgi:putative transport protein
LWGALAARSPDPGDGVSTFRFHDALTLGIVSGARTTTASLGLVRSPRARSRRSATPSPTRFGNTFLTIWVILVMLLASHFGV